MKIAPRQIASFLAKPPDKICAILLHGSDAGPRSSRSQQLAALYSDDLDDVFSVTRISGAGLGSEAGKIADAAAEIPMFGTRLVLVKASGTELLDACKLLLAHPVNDAMVIIDASDILSGKMHAAQIASGITGTARYSEILLLMSGLIAISLLIYAFSKDNLD